MKVFVVIEAVSEVTIKYGTPITVEQMAEGDVYLTFETDDEALQAVANKPKQTKSYELIQFVRSYEHGMSRENYFNLNSIMDDLFYAVDDVKEITFVASDWENDFAYRTMFTVNKAVSK